MGSGLILPMAFPVYSAYYFLIIGGVEPGYNHLLAAWAGISVTPLRILKENEF